MKKEVLELFLKKFNLNGNIDSVKWVVDSKEKQLRTSALTEDRNVMADVKLNNFTDLVDATIGIYNTAQLKQMLNVLGDEIKMELNVTNDKVTSITFSDDLTKIQYVTADLSVIPSGITLKKIPPFNVEIDFNQEFINKFVRAKNALSDINIFTLLMRDNKLELVIGQSNINSNKITLGLVTKNGKDSVTKPISFNAMYLKEILVSNNDCDSAVLKVSDAGLATIAFTKNDFVSEYYLVEVKI